MKSISETHPSLWNTSLGLPCNDLIYAKRITELVQKHTIDKTVLKKLIFDESLFPCYDKHYRNHLCKKLELEE